MTEPKDNPLRSFLNSTTSVNNEIERNSQHLPRKNLRTQPIEEISGETRYLNSAAIWLAIRQTIRHLTSGEAPYLAVMRPMISVSGMDFPCPSPLYPIKKDKLIEKVNLKEAEEIEESKETKGEEGMRQNEKVSIRLAAFLGAFTGIGVWGFTSFTVIHLERRLASARKSKISRTFRMSDLKGRPGLLFFACACGLLFGWEVGANRFGKSLLSLSHPDSRLHLSFCHSLAQHSPRHPLLADYYKREDIYFEKIRRLSD